MKFTLKDYQHDAVIQVLDNLARARRMYHDDATARDVIRAHRDDGRRQDGDGGSRDRGALLR